MISNVAFVNDEHPKKFSFSIEVTDEGIDICVNDLHPLKAPNPIEIYRWMNYILS